jgi:hypothetical protein
MEAGNGVRQRMGDAATSRVSDQTPPMALRQASRATWEGDRGTSSRKWVGRDTQGVGKRAEVMGASVDMASEPHAVLVATAQRVLQDREKGQ